MTGFGRAEKSGANMTATVELASVNRKQADIVINLPRNLVHLEAELRKMVLGKVSRGRVNVAIKLEVGEGEAGGLGLNEGRVAALVATARRLGELTGERMELRASDFLADPGIFSGSEVELDVEAARELIVEALEAALGDLLVMRKREGEDLLADFSARLDFLEAQVGEMEARAPEVLAAHHRHLHQSLEGSGLGFDFSDERLLKELALFAERADISEELTRLMSHLEKFREYLGSAEAVGRALDFLCQETGREFNTIGSKAHDAELAHFVVTARTELEKIREQVQNVE